MLIFEGNYSQYRSRQAEEGGSVAEEHKEEKSKTTGQPRPEGSKRLNPRFLRELEANISALEEELAEVGAKLENPLEATESVADLGSQYVSVKNRLDEAWEKWDALFREKE